MDQLSYGECDRCGSDIFKHERDPILTVRATTIKFDVESYTLQYMLCPRCRKKFENWIIGKGDDAM